MRLLHYRWHASVMTSGGEVTRIGTFVNRELAVAWIARHKEENGKSTLYRTSKEVEPITREAYGSR